LTSYSDYKPTHITLLWHIDRSMVLNHLYLINMHEPMTLKSQISGILCQLSFMHTKMILAFDFNVTEVYGIFCN